MHDLNAVMADSHEKREREFGEKPFTFGYKPREKDEEGNRIGEPEAEVFYVRPNYGYLGVKRVALITEESSGGETFEAIENLVFSLIDPRDNARERFEAVARNEEFPITFEDLAMLQNWLLQEHANLPPTESKPSVPTPGQSGSNSTET